MDEQAAKQLLKKVRGQEKQAVGGAGIGGPSIGGPNPYSPSSSLMSPDRIKNIAAGKQAKNRTSQILQAILMAGGAGLALRSGLGLSRMFSESQAVPSKTVDMDVLIPGEEEKRSEDLIEKAFNAVGMGKKQHPNSTSNIGVPGYLPSLLLGTPLAFAGGWKGMDMLFNKSRKARNKRKTEKAKEDYDAAVLESYKQGSDNALPTEKLDVAFNQLEKAAIFGSENVPGALKGLFATYAALSGPAAYMFVNDRMKKNSTKSIIEKAMKERARRHSQQQPLELYAKPRTVEEEDSEEIN